ncbi:MAG: hypothetical protein OXI34_14110 [Chloroflexota bacterium]|nr:hypothetical protein [Chloroflexota bacterium]MDE2947908.1 hypothetical protein [Chloroflexota bacterium]
MSAEQDVSKMQVGLDYESGFKFGLGFGCASIVIVLLIWVLIAVLLATGATIVVTDFLRSVGA